MKRVAPAFFWAIILFSVVMSFVEIASADVSEHARKLYWQAHDLDKLEDNYPRYTMNDGYVSPFGIQVHPHCFMLAGKEMNLRQQEAEQAFERAFLDAFNSLVNSCQSKYPELEPYISEWVSEMRRTVITCTGKKVEFSAINVSFRLGARYLLEDDAITGIDFGDETEGMSSLTRMLKPTIILTKKRLLEFMKAYESDEGHDDWVVQTIIHEILHSTSANNSRDHNSIENIDPGAHGKCGIDVTSDRINVISHLCSGASLGKQPNPAAQDLFVRFSDCGINSCERLFNQNTRTNGLLSRIDRYYSPGKGLAKDASHKLCARIYNEGSCRYQLSQQGSKITQHNPLLNELGNKIRDRLRKLFPRSPVQLSRELLDAFPGTRENLRELVKSRPCLGKFLSETRYGSFYVLGAGPESFSYLDESPDPRSSNLTAWIRIEDFGKKCGSDDFIALKNVVGPLTEQATMALNSAAYFRAIQPRYRHEAEKTYEINLHDQSFNVPLRSLIGPKLFDDYFAALDRFQYESPNFDCKAAGLYPLDAMGNFLSHMKKAEKRGCSQER